MSFFQKLHKRTVIPVLFIVLMIFMSACGKNQFSSSSPGDGGVMIQLNTDENDIENEVHTGPKRKIIIDTDTGADDSAAIILAAKNEYVKIIGVTTMAGNVDSEQSALNALMALEIAGVDAPVYVGSEESFSGKKIEAYSVFGDDGMGDSNLIHPKKTPQEEDAVTFILDAVSKDPGEIEIVALGPATNIAKAIERDPETMKQVKKIWSLGTTGYGPGNASPVSEFNVYKDVEAYKKMVDFGIPVTIIGLDMCDGESMITGEQFDELANLNETGKFISTSFRKLRDFYVLNGSENSTMNCDSVAMMCVLHPRFITDQVKVHASCITEKGETYGEVIFYKEGFTYDVVENEFEYNVTLITGVKKDLFFEVFRKAIAGE